VHSFICFFPRQLCAHGGLAGILLIVAYNMGGEWREIPQLLKLTKTTSASGNLNGVGAA
jgi:hypothetical protein